MGLPRGCAPLGIVLEQLDIQPVQPARRPDVERALTDLPDGRYAGEALLRVRAVQPLEIDPDGMSGGSAFVIQLVEGQARAYFGGMVVRGGREFFSILKPGFVIAFLDAVFDG